MKAWFVTATWCPGPQKVYDSKGRWAKECAGKVPEGAGAKFSWTVIAESDLEATEIIRKRGYFLAGLDSEFACTAYEVAVLDVDGVAVVPSGQECSAAMENEDACAVGG